MRRVGIATLALMTDQEEEKPEPIAREGEHVPPAFQSEAFHCGWCGVLAAQAWARLEQRRNQFVTPVPVWRVFCSNCHEASFWLEDETDAGAHRCLYPIVGGGPRPHVSMPVGVRADYEEARAIVGMSPRGACALLRLATQKLVDDLQPGPASLNTKIGELVSNGLPALAQQALDALRVIGNEAVHPGELDLHDDIEAATGLFNLLNFIVEDRIEQPKRIREMYDKLPADKLQAIQLRDTPRT